MRICLVRCSLHFPLSRHDSPLCMHLILSYPLISVPALILSLFHPFPRSSRTSSAPYNPYTGSYAVIRIDIPFCAPTDAHFFSLPTICPPPLSPLHLQCLITTLQSHFPSAWPTCFFLRLLFCTLVTCNLVDLLRYFLTLPIHSPPLPFSSLCFSFLSISAVTFHGFLPLS